MTTPQTIPYSIPDLYDATIQQLLQGLDGFHFTVVQLVSTYISRIKEVNLEGAELRAVLEINAAALQQAARCDEERVEAEICRKEGQLKELGPLHGIPILVKDSIATASPAGLDEQLNTSAGSLALRGCYPAKDAMVVRKLREAGGIILGKTNMSEWAHWRGKLPSGWSSVGGQCTNPYYPGGDPSGSSSGSAVAATVGLAAATLGTETDGSISFPSSVCNIVGLKPTVGLTSRSGVIPISTAQDSVGPMCRTISDVSRILQAISGPDAEDQSTMEQPPVPDYLSALTLNFICGKRIGVVRGFHSEISGRKEPESIVMAHCLTGFEEALGHLQKAGAVLIENVEIETARLISEQREKEFRVFRTEFKLGINEYLSNLSEHPTGVHSLEDIIQFNRTHPETHFKGEEQQNHLIKSKDSKVDDLYKEALEFGQMKGGDEGIDACLKKHNLDILVAPWSGRVSMASAVAGYPILTMPLGFCPDTLTPYSSGEGFPPYPFPGLPFGIVFLGGKWSERTILRCAYSLEQSMKARYKRRAYEAAIPKSQLPNFVRGEL